ncbi:MAG: hypothetical protein U1F23_06650 [Lysobacterales bacterium]
MAVSILALSGLLGSVFLVATANAGPAYEVDLSIQRDGVVVSQPHIGLVAGKQVTFTVNSGQPDSALRGLLTVKPSSAGPNGEESAELDLMFFEQYQGEWVLRSEPDVTTFLGQNASLSIQGEGLQRPAPRFDISYMIQRDVSAAASDSSEGGCDQENAIAPSVIGSNVAASSGCPVEQSALVGLSGRTLTQGVPNEPLGCCSAHCPGGNSLVCCGATSCCDRVCGNCCSPP